MNIEKRGFINFLKEVRFELLRRVSWPTREKLITSTLIVIVFILIFTIYLGAWDSLFAYLWKLLTG